MHTCPICGGVVFKSFGSYQEHKENFHGHKRPLEPVRTTNRTHAQIVADAEAGYLKQFLIGGD